jgi:hypothetical protein
MEAIRNTLKSAFPDLGDAFVVTSPQTPDYNCIGWAAGDEERSWWPSNNSYWPAEVPRIATVEAFFQAFSLLGYEGCTDAILEPDYEKLALYCRAGEPTHMARQLPSGRWTSKLGVSFDISHETPEAVFGAVYGNELRFLRRHRRT